MDNSNLSRADGLLRDMEPDDFPFSPVAETLTPTPPAAPPAPSATASKPVELNEVTVVTDVHQSCSFDLDRTPTGHHVSYIFSLGKHSIHVVLVGANVFYRL